ncbi:hypothetical protein [Victivallis sp. Marseille-Q1083]|uniref:hypothetical protein n=1 Tax=Victivallis sp. Marseille-Q1083 TaxID=2717288 RepID=UPI00158E5C53|nr:hypothetical protein [Victivallis sp. Marseille-Q1083]
MYRIFIGLAALAAVGLTGCNSVNVGYAAVGQQKGINVGYATNSGQPGSRIYGLRVNLPVQVNGSSTTDDLVAGWELGMTNNSGWLYGLQTGIDNRSDGGGVQIAALINRGAQEGSSFLQIAPWNDNGAFQIGVLANQGARPNPALFQLALWNLNSVAQLGIFNSKGKFQLGLFNVVDKGAVLQLGLLNYHYGDTALLPFSIGINWAGSEPEPAPEAAAPAAIAAEILPAEGVE